MRSWKLLLPLGRARGRRRDRRLRRRSPTPGRTTIRLAIMTDCKGAFAFGDELDIGGAQAALRAVRGRKAEEQEEAVRGHDRHQGRQHDVKIVGYGCGDDTAATAIKETRRLMEQLRADVMVGPLSGDEAVVGRELCEVAPDEDVHHRHGRVAGPDAADRAEERVPLPRRRRPVERRHRRDRLQEARLAHGRDHHGRLQLRLDVGCGHHRRLLRDRRQDHEARVPAAQHDGLLAVRPAAARARARSTATSGSSAVRGPRPA